MSIKRLVVKINEAKIEIDLCEKSIRSIRAIIEMDLLEKFDKIKESKNSLSSFRKRSMYGV